VRPEHLKQRLKNGVYRSIGEMATTAGVDAIPERTLRVLMYHKINDVEGNSVTVPVSLFDEQMAQLGELGYRPVSLDDVIAHYAEGARLPDRAVLITFDDGTVAQISAADTVLTGLFDGGWPGAPHRVLRNSTFRRWDEAGRPAAGSRPGEGEVVARHRDAEIRRYAADEPRRQTTGDLEAMCLYAGQGVGLVTAIEPAAEVVSRIAAELAEPR